jgi:hypothetical protein
MLAEQLQTKLKRSGAPQAPREIWGLWNETLGWLECLEGPGNAKVWYESESEAKGGVDFYAEREIECRPVDILALIGR